MTQEVAILLLGSNKKEKIFYLESAKSHFAAYGIYILREGEIIETEAEGFTTEENFLNQLVEISTDLTPVGLLYAIKDIEYKIGRIYKRPMRGEIYTDRIIDIDILYYGNINLRCDFLEIPHHQVRTRKFVGNLLKKFYSTD